MAATESVADPDIRQVFHAAFQELDDSFAGADEASLKAIYETGVALICGRPVQP